MCVWVYVDTYVAIYIYTHKATSLDGPTMGPTLNGPFREVVPFGELEYHYMVLYGRSFGTQIKRSI